MIPRFRLKPSQERPPRFSLLLFLLRGVRGTWSCSELCPTVLPWGRFLSPVPIVVVTSLLQPRGVLIPLIRAGEPGLPAAPGGRGCDSIWAFGCSPQLIGAASQMFWCLLHSCTSFPIESTLHRAWLLVVLVPDRCRLFSNSRTRSQADLTELFCTEISCP